MGGSVEHWNNQHIQRHHIETSIIPIDYDTMYPIKRVLTSYKPLWFHKYQHIYMWALYPVTMLAWTLGDVAYIFHPRVSPDDKVRNILERLFYCREKTRVCMYEVNPSLKRHAG